MGAQHCRLNGDSGQARPAIMNLFAENRIAVGLQYIVLSEATIRQSWIAVTVRLDSGPTEPLRVSNASRVFAIETKSQRDAAWTSRVSPLTSAFGAFGARRIRTN